MKRISNWTKLGYICGSIFSILSAIRYFMLYPDMDRAIVYVLIGGIICALSWIYDKLIEHSNTINAMEIYLADKSNEVKDE